MKLIQAILFCSITLLLGCSTTESKISVAVLETIPYGETSITRVERLHITDKIREVVRDHYDTSQYMVMTRENINVLLPPDRPLEECEGGCIVETGRNISADKVMQATISMFAGKYAVSIYYHDTRSGQLINTASSIYPTKENLLQNIPSDVLKLFGKTIPKATICSKSQYYDEINNKCINAYPNSTWIGNGEYKCNDGFLDVESGRYNEKITQPCVKKAICNTDDRYDPYTNACIIKPQNSHWIGPGKNDWMCDTDYNKIGNACVKCGLTQQFNETTKECVSKPSHSHWLVRSGFWMCDDGYIETINHTCERDTDPYYVNDIDITPDWAIQVSSAIGSSITTSENEIGILTLAFGGELGIGVNSSKFRAALSGDLEYQYYDDITVYVHSIRFNVGAKLELGSPKTRGYMQPFISSSLYDIFSIDETQKSVHGSTMKIPEVETTTVTAGVQFGVTSYIKGHYMDFFVRANQPSILTDFQTSSSITILLGTKYSI